MTKEEAIHILNNLKPTDAKSSFDAYVVGKAITMAIKALEQEPILDKIRAEIEQAADKQFQIAMGVSDLNERYAHIQMENAYRHCLNVIDRYKAESEVRNDSKHMWCTT